MAYRTRRRHRRRHRKSAFSKRQVKAIQSIAQKPVETKHYPYFSSFTTWLNSAGYVSGPSAVIRQNIYSEIPQLGNVATKNESAVIGNQFMSRGLRVDLGLYTIAPSPGASFDVWCRFTVYSDNDYNAGTTGPGPADIIFDQDHDTTPILAKWNSQAVKIHFQRFFTIDNNGNQNALKRRKFWVPLRRKITIEADASVVTNSYVRQIKGMQVYWVLEIFVPGLSTALNTYVNGSISTNVYFKDA